MNTSSFQNSIRNNDITWLHQGKNIQEKPKIADRTCVGIPGHEPILWNWYRVPGILGITRSRCHRLSRKKPRNFGEKKLDNGKKWM
jgi:hypothetical protein